MKFRAGRAQSSEQTNIYPYKLTGHHVCWLRCEISGIGRVWTKNYPVAVLTLIS